MDSNLLQFSEDFQKKLVCTPFISPYQTLKKCPVSYGLKPYSQVKNGESSSNSYNIIASKLKSQSEANLGIPTLVIYSSESIASDYRMIHLAKDFFITQSK